MSNIDKIIEAEAASHGIPFTRELKSQVAMRVKYAGVTDDASIEIAVRAAVKRLTSVSDNCRTAGTMRTAAYSQCPKCQSPCETVHLAEGNASSYCPRCRIAAV